MRYILASKSPRRAELLKGIGLNFKIIPSNVDESIVSTNLKPEDYCVKLAQLKSNDISSKYLDFTIIGADTIVYVNEKILNKPKNFIEASKMLNLLSNNTHQVFTGVSIKNINLDIEINFYEKTEVTFNKISENEISKYINDFRPFDKAGGYGIQDGSKVFIQKINGSYENIIGFPIAKFYQLTKDISSL